MADHFCLRWNNYQSNMVSELDILRTEEHLVDVTLSCEGQKFRAHKVILSACSAYFRNVFKENPCEHPVVILKDVNHEDVEALLTFIYQGVVYVSEKKLASFLQTAELLQIKGLTGAASTFKEEQSSLLSDKGPPPLLTPTKPVSLPARKLLPSVSPPPVKRRKGAPVRICKSNDGGEGSDTNSNQGCDDDSQPLPVKQENIEDNDTARQNSPPDEMFDDEISREGLSFEESPRGEGEVDSNEGSASVYASVDMADGEEDGEIKREETTLLERSLVGAGVSRPLDVQNPFPTYPVPVPGQGLSEQTMPTEQRSRGEWRCMQPQRCQLCYKVFSNSGNLRQHVSNVHTPGQHVPCNFCARVFKNKEYLRKHHVQTHNVPLRRQRTSAAHTFHFRTM